MKILIITAVYPPEPIVSAQISYDLAEELSKNNIVSVLCPPPSRPLGFKFEKNEESTSFNVKVLDSYTCPESKLLGRIKESLSFGRKCKKYIESNYQNIDVIYMNVWPVFAQLYILRSAIRFKIKIITHIQDIYPESYTNKLPNLIKSLLYWILLPIDKYVLAKSNQIVTISEKMKNYLIKTRRLNSEKIVVVKNWQDENDFINFQPERKIVPDPEILTFMYLGNIGPVAGVEFLIESFAGAKIPRARLVVAGSGSMKAYCQNLCLKYLDIPISFIDVPAGKVPEIQDQADIMLLPAKKNAALSSIPSKLPAYMFSKKPIIGCVDTDSDTAESIINSQCGWVIEPENREQLIDMFKLVFNESKESRSEKGRNGFNYAMKSFSKKSNLQSMVSIIEHTFKTTHTCQ